MRLDARNVTAAEVNGASGGLIDARDHVEGRGFACAVRTDEPYEFIRLHAQAEIANGGQAAEANGRPVEMEQGSTHIAAAPFFFWPRVNKPWGRAIMRAIMSSE